MAKYTGIRPLGTGIQIRYQIRGELRSMYLPKSPTARNLQEAARLRKSLIEEAHVDEAPLIDKTFADCASMYITDKAKVCKPSTIDNYRSKLEYYWSGLADRPIRHIKLAELKAIDREVEWKSEKTRREVHGVIRGVFKLAIEEDLCDSNPAERLAAGTWKRPEIDAFTEAEQATILEHLSDRSGKTFYGLMFETGCRTGELMALTWDQVGKTSLRIDASIYRGQRGTTKTHQARDVLLTKTAQVLLANHTSTKFKGGHVFLTQLGEPYTVDRSLTFAFKLACEKGGVRYRRPYNCRHTFASRAIMSGCSPTWVAAQMGDRVDTIWRYYVKWISGDQDKIELARFENATRV